MNASTDKSLDEVFERFKNTELAFNKDVIQATGLIHNRIFIKCGASKWPCFLHTASLTKAKVIVRLSPENIAALKAADLIFVNYSFSGLRTTPIPMSFLAPYKLSDLNPFIKLKQNNYLISLHNSSKPQDNLIRFLGDFLEARVNAARRREERVTIDSNSVKVMGLRSAKTDIMIDGVRRPCVILDLSFSGSKLLVNAKESLANKKAILKIIVLDPDDIFEIPCTILRSEIFEGNNGTATLGLLFEEKSVPMELKLRINRMIKGDLAKTNIKDERAAAAPFEKAKIAVRYTIDEEIDRIIAVLRDQTVGEPDREVIKKAADDLRKLKENLKE